MKLKITIIGRVHDVGYRPLLLGLAESLEIERFFADNVFIDGKQAVEILIDDSEDKVKAFMELVKRKKPENAEIESIDVEDYDGRVMKTESYYRYLTAMQLAKIATYGGKMLEKQDKMLEKQDLMLDKQDTMLGKMDLMLEKQDKMLEKQDTMLGKMDLMLDKQDTMLGKMDLMLEKQDKTIEVIREESEKTREELGGKVDSVADKIDLLRVDMKEYMEQRFRKIENEIEKIKAKIGLS